MRSKNEATNQLGLFRPEIEEWVRPDFLPDWTKCPLLALDTETKDDGINNGFGAGWAFKGWGHIAGFSVCNGEKSLYFSLRHPDSDNFDINKAYNWLKAHVTRPDGETIFHHAAYDLGWLFREIGVFHPTKVSDTMAMAFMLDENRFSYGLDNLCRANGIPGKDKKELNEMAKALGLHPQKEMWKLPAKYVGTYGEGDAAATWNLYHILKPQIEEQGLMEAYRLEADLIEVCVQMRLRGVRINEETVDGYRAAYIIERDRILEMLTKEMAIGRPIDMSDLLSSKKLAVFFDNYDLRYPLTNQNAPSFESDWLEAQDHWLPKAVADARKFEQASEKFLNGYIKDFTVDGRLHAEVHQFKDYSEEQKGGGTVTYRFSYSNPPLQQTPQRDPIIGKTIRECFLPEEGEEWLVADYNQQEPRLTVHYAAMLQCLGWEKAVRYYQENEKADYHQMVADFAKIDRKPAKIINLGLAYGMQTPKLSRSLGLSIEEGTALMQHYHEELPYINALSKTCEKKAENTGFIRLIDGARCRFDLWKSVDEWKSAGYPLAKAKTMWPNSRLIRADARKAMNRLIQGSAARQTKKAMLDVYRAGFLPMLQMHDDLNFTIPDKSAGPQIAEIMNAAIPLKIPMRVDLEYGPTWGAAKEIKD